VTLSEAAANAETAIKTGHGVEAALKALSLSLDPVIAGITKALPDESSGNGTATPVGDPATVKEPLIRLKKLLESDDGEAAEHDSPVAAQRGEEPIGCHRRCSRIGIAGLVLIRQ
jgi:hypothetical protein